MAAQKPEAVVASLLGTDAVPSAQAREALARVSFVNADDTLVSTLERVAKAATDEQTSAEEKAETSLTALRASVVFRHSVATYALESAGKLDVPAFAKLIGRSTTRVKDYALYGRAYMVHGVVGDDFAQLQRASSGGHRAEIGAVIRGDAGTMALDTFRETMAEAVALEKKKADERKAERTAARAKQREAEKAVSEAQSDPNKLPALILAAFAGAMGALNEAVGKSARWSDGERKALESVHTRMSECLRVIGEQTEAFAKAEADAKAAAEAAQAATDAETASDVAAVDEQIREHEKAS